MGVGRGVQEERGVATSWIFVHDADKVEEGFMVLCSVLFFTLHSPPGNFSADALLRIIPKYNATVHPLVIER